MSPASPRRLTVLLDVSGSMVEENKWRVVQLIAYDVIKSAPADVEIAVGTFAESYTLLAEYTRDRTVVRETVKKLTFESLKARKGGNYRTVIPESLLSAMRQNHSPSVGDIVYTVTDGLGAGSYRSTRELRDELLRRGTRAYFFFLRAPWEVGGDITASHLEEWAAGSGGSIVDLAIDSYRSDSGFYLELNDENLHRLSWAASALYASMFHFYQVQIQRPQAVRQKGGKLGGKLEASILDGKGEKMKTLRLLYPKRLLRCPASATASAD